MPFVRKTDSQGSQPPTDTRKLFIGRTGELLFFVQNILKPEEPTHNIISIWGQGGVGKSTLLARFSDEANSADFKDYCLTATVDELQTTPASIMEKFAAQLHMEGAFEKALRHYKAVLRTQQTEREMPHDTLVKRTPVFAGAAVEGVPFVGPLLGEGVKATAEHLLDRRYNVQRRRDIELMEDPGNELTQAFVDELNQLVDTRVLLGSGKVKNRRIILFFDTFEQLATEAVPWLLNYLLHTDIKSNVVLVIAGRDPIERSIPVDMKRWMPYYDNDTIYSISLNSFTEDETRSYLIKRDITDPDRIATIWQLSQGLPLYLSLLTSNPRGKVDPAADVVANFLRWIPEKEQAKRQLALDASLFSRPFNLDDLAAFTYLPEQERVDFYYWLTGLSFVYPQEGRFRYHELAQDLFSRRLYQRSKKEYYTTRRSIATYYQRLLEEIQTERGLEAYHLIEWLELVLALTDQLFSLPDEDSHVKAIELVLNIFPHTDWEHSGEIAKFLRDLSEKKASIQISTGAQQAIKHLLQYIEADARSQDRLTAATALLERVEQLPSFLTDALVQIYSDRGWAYLHLKEYEQAMSDFNSALALKPDYAWVYGSRGLAYHLLKDYQRALADFDRAIELNPKYAWAFIQRGRVYRNLRNYQRALEDYDHAVELNPNYVWAYVDRGITYRLLKDYEQALAEFDRALEIEPNYAWAYYLRGLNHLWLKDINQAKVDFTYSRELDQTSLYHGLFVIWTGMCQERPDPGMPERLEVIAATNPEHPVASVCRGVAMWLRKYYKEALAQLEQAIQVGPEEWRWDSYFWQGMTYASLGLEEEARISIEKSLDLELPPILLAPLTWFEQDRPDFYQKYVVSLMARYDLA